MTDPERADELAQDLLRAGLQGDAWERYRSAPEDLRSATVRALKAEVDRRTRAAPQTALAAAQVLLRAADRLPALRPLGLRGRAAALHMNGRSEEARVDYEEAAREYAARGEAGERARVLRSLVDVLHVIGRTDDALSCGAEAKAIFAALDEQALIAQVDVNLGNVHLRRGDPVSARRHYALARDAFERAGDRGATAFAVFSLANLERDAGHIAQAEEGYRAARAAWEASGLLAHVADCDASLAGLDSRRGRFADAILGLERARDAYARASRPPGVPECNLELAELHLRLDANHDALECARQAAQGFAAAGYALEQGRACLASGLALARVGDTARGLADLEQAERKFRELGNRIQLAVLALFRSDLLIAAGRAEEALEELLPARRHAREAQHTLLEQLLSVALARAQAAAGRLAESKAELDALLGEEMSSPLDVLARIEALRTQAELARRAADLPAELRHLGDAALAIQASYVEVLGEDARIAFFRRHHQVFVDLAAATVQAGEEGGLERAVAELEASRRRSRAAHGGEPHGTELAALRERMDWLLSRRMEHELRGVPSPPSDAELFECERALMRHERGRRRAAPGTDGREGSRTAGELLGARAEGETLLLYMWSSRGLSVFVADAHGLRSVRLPAEAGFIDAAVARLRLQLTKFRHGEAYVGRHGAHIARSLAQVLRDLNLALLSPLEGTLEPGPLVIVPYGRLHGLPFHALPFEGAPLIASREVSYAPSLKLLAELREPRAAAGAGVLAVAAGSERAPGLEGESAALERVYGSAVERAEPAQLMARLREQPPRLLHLAAHGSFRPDHPLFSGIDLGGTFLTAYDLRSFHLPADLVVVSGCETARQARVDGEELQGIERALLDAGVRAVVGSLWPVLDEPAAELIQRFYEELARGRTARTALALAQRELIARRADVAAWAPFVLVGNPDAACPAPRGSS